MLKIVICDDEVIFTETMKEALAREFGLHGLQCEYSCYTDGKNLLQKVGQTEPEDFPESDSFWIFPCREPLEWMWQRN